MKIFIPYNDKQIENKRGVDLYTDKLIEGVKSKQDVKLVKNLSDSDLVHLTAVDFFGKPENHLLDYPYIYTIHDLIPIKFPNHFPKGIKGSIKWMFNKRILKKSQVIITDSEGSKQDIVNLLNYPEEKIAVIPLAAREQFKPMTAEQKEKFKSVKEKYSLPDDFVLYVGDVNWNKNLPGLAKACIELEIPLVVVGSKASVEEYDQDHPENRALVEFKQLKKENPELVITTGFVPDRYLVYLYNVATFYCQPSFYEGFGLPLLEAMACGCPVISSDRASLPEVGGDAPVYFNPREEGELINKLRELWKHKEDINIIKNMTKRSLKQAQAFSWKKTVSNTIKVYQKLL
jgi:glycosyltransferase involved in cell wall biosynthesis